jgi:hypothetical protein
VLNTDKPRRDSHEDTLPSLYGSAHGDRRGGGSIFFHHEGNICLIKSTLPRSVGKYAWNG